MGKHSAEPIAVRKENLVNRSMGFLASRKAIPLRIILLLFWLAAMAFGGIAQGKVATVSQNDQAVFLPESAESTLASEAAKPFQDSTSIPALIVAVNAKGSNAALTAEQMQTLRDLAGKLPEAQIPNDLTFAEMLTGEMIPVIPNEDGTAALIPASFDTKFTGELDANGDKRMNSLVDATRDFIAAELPSDAGIQVYVSGPAGLAADLGGAFAGIDLTLLLVALVLVFIILVFVYRSVLMPIAVLVTAMAALCAAVFVVYHLAKAGVLALNGQTQGILAILVIGATTDYCLLLIARYREELGVQPTPIAAMAKALKGAWEPIAASGFTVIAGLLTLLVSDLSSTASLGPIAAIGIGFAMLSAFTLLPGILQLPGKHAKVMFWPAKIKHYASEQEAINQGHGIWSKVAHAVARKDRPVWISIAVILGAFALLAPSFIADGTSTTEQFRNAPDSVTGFDIIGEKFDAGSTQPTTVVIVADQMDAALTAIEEIDGVASVEAQSEGAAAYPAAAVGGGAPMGDVAQAPIVEGAENPPEVAAQLAQQGGAAQAPAQVLPEPTVVDGKVLLNVTTTMPSEEKSAQQVVRDIREAVHNLDSEALVGGPAAQTLDTNLTAERDFHVIVPVILAVIFLLLILLLRSIVAPLLLLVANLISFGATLGISKLIFFDVLDHPGADSSVPIYAFVFLVALGIDYTIFLMSRVREESIKFGTHEGLVHGVAVTGGVITSAGIVLATTFAALVVVPLLFMFQLAIIVALGILIDTFIVRSLLIPGVVHDIGRPVWWPWSHKKVRAEKE